ncbi:MAG: 50S ribosomal protein L6, partial [Bacteroidetes bacterium SW_10_40_5]
MSRIGYAPIQIPENVEVNIQKDNVVHVKGPKGEITQKVHPNISVQMEDSTITFDRPSNQKRFKAYHGLYRSLVANMVHGVNQGYQKQLELIGVGFKATVDGQVIELSVGYSHDILFELPEE